VTQAMAGGPVRLGSLEPVRDLNFVANTVDGFLLAASAKKAVGKVVNLGSGTGISVGELAYEIFRLLGVSPEIKLDSERVRPDASEVMKLIASASRAKELLGWSPRVSLESGLGLTIEWIAKHLDQYKTEIYNV